MKRFFWVPVLAFVFIGCNNNKKEEKAALNSVLRVHDIVMDNDERLMKINVLLYNLARASTAEDVKDSSKFYLTRVNAADSAMDNWMHNFDPEHKAASHKENMDYLEHERDKIKSINKQLTNAINQSDKYLATQKGK